MSVPHDEASVEIVADSRSLEQALDRRVGERRASDRRKGLRIFNRRHLGVGGRRGARRRESDSEAGYTDVYPRSLLWMTCAILALSVTDATLTLELLRRGAVELNAVMAALITKDIQTFVSVKLALTGLSLVLLVIHYQFHILRIRMTQVIGAFLLGYGALIVYEIYLLSLPY